MTYFVTMALTDASGRPYARLEIVRRNTWLVADEGFWCVKPGERVRVREDKCGHDGRGRRLYLGCMCVGKDGRNRHYLDKQHDGDGGLVGLYHAEIFEGQDPTAIFKRDEELEQALAEMKVFEQALAEAMARRAAAARRGAHG